MKMINKLLVTILLVMGYAGVQANDSESLDTILKVEGKKMVVDVTKVTPQYVSFIVPGKDDTYTMERKQIHKIIYKNGRIEEFNDMAFEIIDESSYKAVWLTDNKKETEGLYRRGFISAKSSPSSRSPKAAKKNATIRAQKKAAAIKGSTILVTKRLATGGYGEFPGYYLEGIVYGLEPLGEGEAETKDMDEN